jgi:hypothetical protein
MCNFFSAISNGEGKTLFFKLEDIVTIMAEGNLNNLDWNSHTSIAFYNNIKGLEEDKWNKWEYDVDKKLLNIDRLNTTDDGIKVKENIEKYLENKNILFIRNLYNKNSGSRNSGSRNSGSWNSGSWNSGDGNSGSLNSGSRNSGDGNSGSRNSGSRNSGDGNSGYWNTGEGNSGSRNSGSWNSGSWNSGDGNSGSWNSGDGNSGSLNTTIPDQFRVFNKWITNEDYNKISWPNFFYFNLTLWISHDTATQEEKKKYKNEIEVSGGFLKTLDYKEAWKLSYKKASKEDRAKVKNILGFDKKLFEEITGIKIR